jgi:fatty-acyl-CoA synthase
MMDFPLTLTHILERAGKLFGRVEIVSRMPDKSLHRYSYADFYRRARQLAEALQRAGLRRGDRIATLMWNHYAHLEAYFGIPAAGGVLHTLNLRLAPDDIAYIVNHAEDRFLIVDDVLLPLFEQFKDKVSLERVFVVPLTGNQPPQPYENYETFLKTASGEFQYPDIDEDEAAGMCYTSGTTGKPKGVVYSHRALVLHSLAAALTDTLAISHRDTVTPVVPMFHANAWGVPFAATMVGAKQVFPGPHLDAESLLNLFENEQVTFAAGVPTIWLGIVQALEKQPERWKLPQIRMAVGGSAAPEGLIRAFDRFGCRVIHAWGMTETTPLGTVSQPKRYMDDWTEDEQYSVRTRQGLAVPFVEMRVVNDDGEAPWDGVTMGELQVRGPWITGSYYNQADASGSFTDDGWLRTGDIATIDPEGYMKITDRTKDLIKSGGEWISSVDLENALMGHPAVAEAAVVAVPHPKWQERPLAAVVLKPGVEATPEELRAHLASKFAKWWVPDAFVFIDQVPRTSAGKFKKAALREQFKDWQWPDER